MTSSQTPVQTPRAERPAARALVAWWPLLAIAAITVLVRTPFFYWPLTMDEAAYGYTTQWWFRGLTLYSSQLWLDRPQGIYLAYQLGFLLLGGATWAIRLWAALWAAATAIAVYAVGRRLVDERAALAGSFLFAVFSASPHIEGFTANSELFMILPATLSAYWLLARRPFWGGLAASTALLLKPSGAAAYLLALLWLACERSSWRSWLRYGLGALLPLLLSVAHGAATAGLGAYAYAVALFELGPGWGPHADMSAAALHGWVGSSPAWGPLLMLGLLGVARAQRGARTFMLFWLLSSLAGVALGGRWYPHYFTQLVPVLAACAGAGLVVLRRSSRRWLRWIAAVGVLAVFLLWEGPFLVYQLAQAPALLQGRQQPQMSDEVAAYIRAHTTEDQTIYVAFAPARICYQAGRRSVTPYLFWIHLFYHPGAYDALVEAIEAREPAYVLLLDHGIKAVDPEDRFGQALEENYEVERTFEGVPLYRPRPR